MVKMIPEPYTCKKCKTLNTYRYIDLAKEDIVEYCINCNNIKILEKF